MAQIRSALAELNPRWKGSFTVEYLLRDARQHMSVSEYENMRMRAGDEGLMTPGGRF